MPAVVRLARRVLWDATTLQIYSGTATLLWGLWVGAFDAFSTAPNVYHSFTATLPASGWGMLALVSGTCQLITLGRGVPARRYSAMAAVAWWAFLAGGFASAAWRVTAVPNYACQSLLAMAWYWLLGRGRE